MSYIEAFLQAVLQGLTEFLRVSSSGHLSLFQHFTGQSGESGVFFSLMLHLGTSYRSVHCLSTYDLAADFGTVQHDLGPSAGKSSGRSGGLTGTCW